jgi:cyclase
VEKSLMKKLNVNSNSAARSNTTRREALQTAGGIAGGIVLARLAPRAFAVATPTSAPQAEGLAAARAEFGKAPIVTTKLSDNVTLLSGPGGNVIVLNGPEGKLLVDTFVIPAWDKMKKVLDGISDKPVKLVINTHWHWDHTDNNANLHGAGATLMAHENTLKRMSEPHDLEILNLHIDPFPADSMPEHTFKEAFHMRFGGEELMIGHFAPAHTDSDIYVHFKKANLLHMGDVFFNGSYCYIDRGTGGSANGMIHGATRMLQMIDNDTKVVPGHGPVGNKSDLTKFRDMVVTARDRVQKLKASGKSLQQTIAAKPVADLESVWGNGKLNGDAFVQVIYTTL